MVQHVASPAVPCLQLKAFGLVRGQMGVLLGQQPGHSHTRVVSHLDKPVYGHCLPVELVVAPQAHSAPRGTFGFRCATEPIA